MYLSPILQLKKKYKERKRKLIETEPNTAETKLITKNLWATVIHVSTKTEWLWLADGGCSFLCETIKPHDLSFKTFETARMVEGVVRQQPPMSLAPESRHLVANDSNLPSPRHFDGSHFLARPSHTSPLLG